MQVSSLQRATTSAFTPTPTPDNRPQFAGGGTSRVAKSAGKGLWGFFKEVTTAKSPYPGISNGLYRLDTFLHKGPLVNNTVEMIVLDLLGFGVLRSGMDFIREFLYKKGTVKHPKVNGPAAKERIEREIGSILTDNIFGGVMAAGIGTAMAGAAKGFSNQFVSQEGMELFREMLCQSRNETEFVSNLSRQIAGARGGLVPTLEKTIAEALKSPAGDATEKATIDILKRLGMTQVDIKLGQGAQASLQPLDRVLAEAKILTQYAQKAASKGKKSWAKAAISTLESTMKLNSWRTPLSMITPLILTFSIPYMIRQVTKKREGKDYYPGEHGLYTRATLAERKDDLLYKYAPFVADSLKDKRIMPTLLTLLPLTMGLGMFNIGTLSDTGSFAKAFNNPLKPKAYMNNLLKMFQFKPTWPHTSGPQMGALYACLVTSRLLFSRTENEFWERLVDSMGGWMVWILGTPFIKRAIVSSWDRTDRNSKLLKDVGGARVIRNRLEIGLLKPGAVRLTTLRKNMLMTAGSLAASLTLMGIIEPYISIKMSEWRSNKQRREDELLKASTLAFLKDKRLPQPSELKSSPSAQLRALPMVPQSVKPLYRQANNPFIPQTL